MEILRDRLTKRGTETQEVIERRLARAKMEMEMAEVYDNIVINDNLDEATSQVEELIFQ